MYRPKFFERWITLSAGSITIQRIAWFLFFTLIHCIAITWCRRRITRHKRTPRHQTCCLHCFPRSFVLLTFIVLRHVQLCLLHQVRVDLSGRQRYAAFEQPEPGVTMQLVYQNCLPPFTQQPRQKGGRRKNQSIDSFELLSSTEIFSKKRNIYPC